MQMRVSLLRRSCLGAAGFLLLTGGGLLAAGSARAQLNPQDLLKQVLPGGATQDQGSGDSDSAGERACQRYAEKKGLDVRRVRDTRRSGRNNLEITLSVEDRHDRYDARCIYDTNDQEVRELTPVDSDDRAADRNGGIDERLARRAQDACEQLAEDRDLQDVDLGEARARGHDTVEVGLRARVHGERQNLTCLYDNDQRHAVLAE
jgi:hypothetical protein